MYVGLDISKNEIVCIGKDKNGNVKLDETFPTSREGVCELVKKAGKHSEFVLEASTHGTFVLDCLRRIKANVVIANPSKLRLIYDSEKKTDRTDAMKLADLLRMKTVPQCHIPGEKTREIRDTIRQRRSIVDMRSAIKNKMRAILAREGVEGNWTDIMGIGALEELSEIQLSNPTQKDALDRLIHIGGTLTGHIDDYDAKIRDIYDMSKDAQLLDTVPGISYYSAVHIASAIDNIGRFASDEELASYAGLVPRIYQSGETRFDTGLVHGDKQLRRILVQDANAAVLCSRRFRKLYLRKKHKKGHQKAIVSVARKMVEIIYWILTRGEPYSENYGK